MELEFWVIWLVAFPCADSRRRGLHGNITLTYSYTHGVNDWGLCILIGGEGKKERRRPQGGVATRHGTLRYCVLKSILPRVVCNTSQDKKGIKQYFPDPQSILPNICRLILIHYKNLIWSEIHRKNDNFHWRFHEFWSIILKKIRLAASPLPGDSSSGWHFIHCLQFDAKPTQGRRKTYSKPTLTRR